ncbi:quinolinate phosphoribosyltransferase [decarboxylating] 1a isoform X2 [Beta vulgaris subsp. vulgaris]|uniref:quinolinate phosphoribosyltransferase [decarboxylating] 1a isoform X2 n=1 Tax=Beta vulgaris subsp. vulgaris TaxID=3555 RepID=UPI002036BE64|nr:quinolinate phosphoribosyltransferase [decarboxylating] 1a isoform X2 [Beta vulgaris subsp. vulgaris]
MESKAPPCHPTYDLKAVIKLALAEDSADLGDVTSMATIPAEVEVEAHFLAKEDGIVAGIALAEMIFHEVDPCLKVEWCQKDGDHVLKGLRLGKVYGKAHSIVVAERVVLNFMQRMSGIATLTKAMAEAAFPAVILETRKTAPGLRLVDKWAVLIGGGKNHRLGLFDMLLIKDNHISIAGGITEALKSADHYLLQNNLQMEVEASGNVTLDTVHQIGQTGVTYISSGALTHSVRALDISLKIDTDLALEVGRRTNRA